jgi:hypothetical protein
VQHALERAVAEALGHAYAARRFLPFVIMHEFEGLLFSDCGRFADAIGQPDLAGSFQKIRDAFVTPEEINDSPLTAPSKRVETLLPGYAKPLMGPAGGAGDRSGDHPAGVPAFPRLDRAARTMGPTWLDRKKLPN